MTVAPISAISRKMTELLSPPGRGPHLTNVNATEPQSGCASRAVGTNTPLKIARPNAIRSQVQ